jgi:transposase
MIADVKNLPSDTSSLRQIIMALVAQNQDLTVKTESLKEANQELSAKAKSLVGENKSLSETIEFLKCQLALLKAKQFGASSEKLKAQIEQLELKIEESELLAEEEAVQETIKSDEKIKQQPKRLKLPEHLERTDVILNHAEECPSCGGKSFRRIDEDISEVLEYVPSSFKVIRYKRPRSACIKCEKIVQSPQASKTIDKGKGGSGLLAHIIIQKYCNHLPLYRQSQIYKREGIELSRSTMASWAGQCARLLEPLIKEIRESIFSSSHIHGDDTIVKVLAPGMGKTKTGRLWVYVRDGRSYNDKAPPGICYYYSPDRKGERPREHLKEFSGILHADAYSGYDKLYKEEGSEITEAACWAHARRKFYEVTVTSDKANIAISVLEEIGKIYNIEESIKGLNPEERLKYRQEHSKPLVDKLFTSLKKFYGNLPRKSMTAKAIVYALNNQAALMRFLEDGKVQIDNNIAERAIRPIAIGRKNWLFAGSDRGGETAANIYTLIETAKMNGLNPWKYLRQVLATIQDYNSQKISELLPWNIKLE